MNQFTHELMEYRNYFNFQLNEETCFLLNSFYFIILISIMFHVLSIFLVRHEILYT